MSGLISTTAVTLTDGPARIAAMCDHLVGHGATLQREGGAFLLGFPFGQGRIDLHGDLARIEARAPDIARLHDLRGLLAGHLEEFVPGARVDCWQGDGADLAVPPNWRVLTVIGVTDLTPRMRRIRLRGDDLAVFAGLDNIHVRLAFPPPAKALIAPQVSASGRESWPDHPDRPALRRYTIREIDALAGWLDVDFVLHEEASGPGSRFAASAAAGDVIGLIGPGGGSIPLDRDWYLIAGDETALPAIARMVALMPADARGQILIEVHDPAEAQPLQAPDGLRVTYVPRQAGLAQAAMQVAVPPDATRPFVWVGCEYADFRDLRRHVRDGLRLGKGCHNIVAYWRKGEAGH